MSTPGRFWNSPGTSYPPWGEGGYDVPRLPYAGTIPGREVTIDEVGRKIFCPMPEVASGRKSPEAEASGYHHEFEICESLWPTL
ncbi:MAG: hypothetical protein HY508_16435 [Acidobacteria bacterium]|nr:hypothetical protein [Acidobacteriota bacterium]